MEGTTFSLHWYLLDKTTQTFLLRFSLTIFYQLVNKGPAADASAGRRVTALKLSKTFSSTLDTAISLVEFWKILNVLQNLQYISLKTILALVHKERFGSSFALCERR